MLCLFAVRLINFSDVHSTARHEYNSLQFFFLPELAGFLFIMMIAAFPRRKHSAREQSPVQQRFEQTFARGGTGVCIHWTGTMDWTTGLGITN